MRNAIFLLAAAGGVLSGCGNSTSSTPAGTGTKGRYSGIGVFDAGRLWGQMVGPQQSHEADAAKLADDEHVIVIVDTITGEVRQCGDHSGYCVAMNPWSGARPTVLPAKLAKHMSDLAAEDRASSR